MLQDVPSCGVLWHCTKAQGPPLELDTDSRQNTHCLRRKRLSYSQMSRVLTLMKADENWRSTKCTVRPGSHKEHDFFGSLHIISNTTELVWTLQFCKILQCWGSQKFGLQELRHCRTRALHRSLRCLGHGTARCWLRESGGMDIFFSHYQWFITLFLHPIYTHKQSCKYIYM